MRWEREAPAYRGRTAGGRLDPRNHSRSEKGQSPRATYPILRWRPHTGSQTSRREKSPVNSRTRLRHRLREPRYGVRYGVRYVWYAPYRPYRPARTTRTARGPRAGVKKRYGAGTAPVRVVQPRLQGPTVCGVGRGRPPAKRCQIRETHVGNFLRPRRRDRGAPAFKDGGCFGVG